MFRVAGYFFFFTRDALKHGSSYQGQKSYRNDDLELEGGSTYQGLKLPKVKLQ